MSRMLSLNYSAGVARAPEGEVHAVSESGEAELTISQMSRLYGVSLRTLRFYEDRGLIKPRREGNARFYRRTRGISRRIAYRAVRDSRTTKIGHCDFGPGDGSACRHVNAIANLPFFEISVNFGGEAAEHDRVAAQMLQ